MNVSWASHACLSLENLPETRPHPHAQLMYNEGTCTSGENRSTKAKMYNEGGGYVDVGVADVAGVQAVTF